MILWFWYFKELTHAHTRIYINMCGCVCVCVIYVKCLTVSLIILLTVLRLISECLPCILYIQYKTARNKQFPTLCIGMTYNLSESFAVHFWLYFVDIKIVCSFLKASCYLYIWYMYQKVGKTAILIFNYFFKSFTLHFHFVEQTFVRAASFYLNKKIKIISWFLTK